MNSGATLKPLVRLPTDPNDCWEWIGADNGRGRAVKAIDGTNHSAARWLWESLFGLLTDEVQVSPKCGNWRCVNPYHLRAVSRAEVQQQSSPLTPGDVTSIRSLAIKGGVSHTILAERFGVDPTTITKIVQRKRWKTKRRAQAEAA